jgi:hypothetical protein
MDQGTDEQRYSFDEYKLYYESTEKVTDRRLAANNWNYGLCTAVIIAIAGLANWSPSQPGFGLVIFAVILMLAGMGMLLCTLWIGQIRDFKELNDAKFKVLNAMAPLVQFGAGDARTSATPFEREWKIMDEKKATRKVSSMRIVALGSSDTEIFIPTAFRWLFGFAMAVTTIIAVVNWPSMTNGIFILKPPAGTGPATPISPGSPQTGRP